MKKVIISAALFTVLSASGWAANNVIRDDAKGAAKATVETSVKNGVYNLVYKTAHAGAVKVTITNEAGTIVLVDQINAEGSFLRPYNFAGLPSGAYTLTVLDRNGKSSLTLIHANGVVQSLPAVEIKSVEAKKYALTLIGNPGNGVQVNIYDATSTLVYSDLIAEKGSFTRVYDLNQLSTDKVTFEVMGPNGVVSKKQF